jgi:hypothetical protein
VALPVYQFLIYRWGWRLLAWAVFLWRLSRVRLQRPWIRHQVAPGQDAGGRAPPRKPDIQSLNDLAGSFEVIRRMRVVPFGMGLVLILVAATLAPMVPLVFLAFPMDALLELAARLIFGL